MDGKFLAYGAVLIAAASMAAAGYLMTPAPAQVTKPIPKVQGMDMRRFFEQSDAAQADRDLNSLGKMGPAHDAWILKKYQHRPPMLEPDKPARPPQNPNTRIRPRPLIWRVT